MSELSMGKWESTAISNLAGFRAADPSIGKATSLLSLNTLSLGPPQAALAPLPYNMWNLSGPLLGTLRADGYRGVGCCSQAGFEARGLIPTDA